MSTAPGNLFAVDGKTALVTGGSRGIGLMIASGLVAAGANVYISSRKVDVCDRVAAELGNLGRCTSLPADLASEDGCRTLTDQLAAREPRLDILVNNAGAGWEAALDEHDERSWNRVLNLNVQAVFHLTRFLLPLLRAAAPGSDPARVINVGSIDGFHVPQRETYSYSASKAAVHHLTRHLARQLGPEVTVNAIAPGPFESRMTGALLASTGDEIANSAPLRRIGRPDDVAGAVIFLASRAGSYVTGDVLAVDGGIGTCR